MFKARDSSKEKLPALIPLSITITIGSLAEILRVKLLSNPQKRHAPNIPAALSEIPHTPPGFNESMILAEVIKKIANHTCLPIASLNIKAAIMVVATPSKLSKRDAVAAGV